MNKICKRCNITKPRGDYGSNKTFKDGLSFYCKDCSKKLRDTKYRETQKGCMRTWYLRNKERVIKLVNKANKERDRGLLFKYYSAIRRCKYPSQSNYKYYGGLGVRVEWDSYLDFKKDMEDSYIKHLNVHGFKQTTLDRINPFGNYSVDNCRWATTVEQSLNKRVHNTTR